MSSPIKNPIVNPLGKPAPLTLFNLSKGLNTFLSRKESERMVIRTVAGTKALPVSNLTLGFLGLKVLSVLPALVAKLIEAFYGEDQKLKDKKDLGFWNHLLRIISDHANQIVGPYYMISGAYALFASFFSRILVVVIGLAYTFLFSGWEQKRIEKKRKRLKLTKKLETGKLETGEHSNQEKIQAQVASLKDKEKKLSAKKNFWERVILLLGFAATIPSIINHKAVRGTMFREEDYEKNFYNHLPKITEDSISEFKEKRKNFPENEFGKVLLSDQELDDVFKNVLKEKEDHEKAIFELVESIHQAHNEKVIDLIYETVRFNPEVLRGLEYSANGLPDQYVEHLSEQSKANNLEHQKDFNVYKIEKLREKFLELKADSELFEKYEREIDLTNGTEETDLERPEGNRIEEINQRKLSCDQALKLLEEYSDSSKREADLLVKIINEKIGKLTTNYEFLPEHLEGTTEELFSGRKKALTKFGNKNLLGIQEEKHDGLFAVTLHNFRTEFNNMLRLCDPAQAKKEFENLDLKFRVLNEAYEKQFPNKKAGFLKNLEKATFIFRNSALSFYVLFAVFLSRITSAFFFLLSAAKDGISQFAKDEYLDAKDKVAKQHLSRKIAENLFSASQLLNAAGSLATIDSPENHFGLFCSTVSAGTATLNGVYHYLPKAVRSNQILSSFNDIAQITSGVLAGLAANSNQLNKYVNASLTYVPAN